MSGFLASSLALAAVTEPPYWMRRVAETSLEMLSLSHWRRKAWTSWACKRNTRISVQKYQDNQREPT